MIDKQIGSPAEAVSEIFDGATVMIGGFGEAGSPIELIHALIDQGTRDLTVVNNNTGSGHVGLAALIENRQVRKMICSFPRTANSLVFPELYRAGEIELELVPQGTLAERIRAGGAGIPAFYTPSSVGTPLAEGKEVRQFNGQDYVMEYGLTADFALIKCRQADRLGNLVYNKTARNFSPLMCMAATTTIVQTKKLLPPGGIDPEVVVTPGIFVNRVVEVPDRRLAELERIVRRPRTVANVVEFVDIAGLVEGASQGEGLGNKFLHHIRETDAIVQVVRCFDGGYGATMLARIVGHKKAREIWYLCRQYSAQEALDMGLVNTVVPLERLDIAVIDGLGAVADFFFPLVDQRHRCVTPHLHLFIGWDVKRMCVALHHLLSAGRLVLGPALGEAARPFRRAVIVEDRPQIVGHSVIGVHIDQHKLRRNIERHVEVIGRLFVDPEDIDRVPREGDGVRSAVGDRFARLGREGGAAGVDPGLAHRRAADAETPGGERLYSGFDQLSASLVRRWRSGDKSFSVEAIASRGDDIAKANTDFPRRVTTYPEEDHLLVRFAVRDEDGWTFNAWIHPNSLTTEVLTPGVERNLLANEAFDLGFDYQRQRPVGDAVQLRWGLDYYGRRGVEALERDFDLAAGGASPTLEQRTLDGGSEDEAYHCLSRSRSTITTLAAT